MAEVPEPRVAPATGVISTRILKNVRLIYDRIPRRGLGSDCVQCDENRNCNTGCGIPSKCAVILPEVAIFREDRRVFERRTWDLLQRPPSSYGGLGAVVV